MRRSRIITEVKDISKETGVNKPEGVEKRTGEAATATLEELVAISSSELQKQNVYNAKGERLGNIEDLMIDLHEGRVIYAVLSFGGISGMGSKLFAIPWELLCIDNSWNYQDIYRQRVVFNVSKEKLKKAPGFDKDKWPREPDKKWLNEVFTYYACQPYWESPEEAGKPRTPSA